jgi:hypothetical protein
MHSDAVSDMPTTLRVVCETALDPGGLRLRGLWRLPRLLRRRSDVHGGAGHDRSRGGHPHGRRAMPQLHDLFDVMRAIAVAARLVGDQLEDLEKAMLAIASHIREEQL